MGHPRFPLVPDMGHPPVAEMPCHAEGHFQRQGDPSTAHDVHFVGVILRSGWHGRL